MGAVLGVPVHGWDAAAGRAWLPAGRVLLDRTCGRLRDVDQPLRACQRVRFEVTEDAAPADQGQRYAFTPDLGIFHATTGPHGDIQVSEHRLRTAMTAASAGGISLTEALAELLGEPWDAELEVFRYAGEDALVRWLHRVG